MLRYTIKVDESFQTPLPKDCSFARAFYYKSNVYLDYTKGGLDFAISGKIIAPGIFKWIWSDYEYRGMKMSGSFNVCKKN